MGQHGQGKCCRKLATLKEELAGCLSELNSAQKHSGYGECPQCLADLSISFCNFRMMLHSSFLVVFLSEELDVFEAPPRLHGLHDGVKPRCCQGMLG